MAGDGIHANTRNPQLSSDDDDFTPDLQSSLMGNWMNGHAGMTREMAATEIIRLFLIKKGVNDGPKTARDLFPPAWKIGKTPIPVDFKPPGGVQLRDAIPDIRAYDGTGEEVRWLGADMDMSPVVRLKADWSAAVDMAGGVWSAVQKKVVTRDDILRLSEQSHEAYARLKEAVAVQKAHINRLLDPVAGRRDPTFNQVAARYKAQIRSLTEEQAQASLRLHEISGRLQKLLVARDDELAGLDQAYKRKHVSAAAVGLGTRQKKRRR
ncbi:hypothetical protein V1525DRAFT_5254 [Lipomyces kononenkoae]|uniref:Uncharacterized protein n=1 Tax=Lipomyces kononenkoae TaxID=34357 RepID=A0ACC3TCC2_LIPKO